MTSHLLEATPGDQTRHLVTGHLAVDGWNEFNMKRIRKGSIRTCPFTTHCATISLIRQWQHRSPLLHLKDCPQQHRQQIFLLGGPIYRSWNCWARIMACNLHYARETCPTHEEGQSCAKHLRWDVAAGELMFVSVDKLCVMQHMFTSFNAWNICIMMTYYHNVWFSCAWWLYKNRMIMPPHFRYLIRFLKVTSDICTLR